MKKLRFGTKMIIGSYVSLLFIALFISSFTYNYYRRSMAAKISDSIMQTFIQANEFLDYNIRSYENQLYLVSVNQTIQRILGTTFTNQYEWYTAKRELSAETYGIAVNHIDIPSIQYYFLRKQNIAISPAYTSVGNLLPEDFVDTALDSQGLGYIWSNICIDEETTTRNCYLTVSKLFTHNTQKTNDAIIYITINIQKLFSSLNRLEYQNGNIFVLSPDNEILYDHNTENIGNTYDSESLTDKFANQPKGVFVESIGGTKCLIVFNSENKNNWTLVGILPYDSIMNEISAARNLVFGITFLVTLAAFLFVYFYLYNHTKKLTQLATAMEEVGNGSLDVQLQLNGSGEIEQMTDVFLSMLSRIKHQIGELEESRKREHRLELQALQEQINPHLLYNTLSTINSYAEDIDAVEISQAVMALITYYKLTLSEGMEFITVKEELSHVDAYTRIMKMRFEDALTVNTIIDPQVCPYACPKLLLQPFIENSIYHGFSKNDHYQGVITLEAFLKKTPADGQIVFKITDNGCGMSQDMIDRIMSEPGNSYAIKNTDARIKLYFGKDYGIQIASRPGKGCIVTVTIPAVSK